MSIDITDRARIKRTASSEANDRSHWPDVNRPEQGSQSGEQAGVKDVEAHRLLIA